MSQLLTFLGTSVVHGTYMPVNFLTLLHASRVTVVWAQACRGKDRRKASFVQGLLGYLTLAWGGGTMVSMLLSQPPAWLVSPFPWLAYPLAYILLFTTGISELLTQIHPVVFTLIDAVTRSSTVVALPTLIANSGLGNNWWTHVVLSGIAVSGGGWIAGALGMMDTQWSFNAPAVLKGGVWATLDVWSGMLVALVFGVLQQAYPDYQAASSSLFTYIPEGFGKNRTGTVDKETAHGVSAVVLAGLLAARVLLA